MAARTWAWGEAEAEGEAVEEEGREEALETWAAEGECSEEEEEAGALPCRGALEAEEGEEEALVIMVDTLEEDLEVTLETLEAT